jgi:FixJ family two-component response regulator
LQKRLTDRIEMPIIFITGYGDVPMTVRAMKAGAAEFLTKPFSGEVLVSAIRQAIERSQSALNQKEDARALNDRYAAQPARARGHSAGRNRQTQQAGGFRARPQRDYRERRIEAA